MTASSPIDTARPGAAARESDANRQVTRLLQRLVDEGREVGVQVCAYLDGECVIDAWAGIADQSSGRPVDGDTLFNVYSVSKAIVAGALHLQVARGLIDYDERVGTYWPEYACNGKETTTVRDILTHRSGLAQMPEGITPEQMCDWDNMTTTLASLAPLAPPGTKALYQSMTFGWLVGELVRRTDPAQRLPGDFVRDEIALPLAAPDLWIGLPDNEAPRVAKMIDAVPPYDKSELFLQTIPNAVDLVPRVFERADVRRAQIAGVGGIFTARSCARYWSMLAQGGTLDGVRLLPEELVATFRQPRGKSDEADAVIFGQPLPLTIGGFWLGAPHPPAAAARNGNALCHPGAGNTLAWADMETRLAVSICHNRMTMATTREEDTMLVIGDSVRAALGLSND